MSSFDKCDVQFEYTTTFLLVFSQNRKFHILNTSRRYKYLYIYVHMYTLYM